jgi:hypothetical protein
MSGRRSHILTARQRERAREDEMFGRRSVDRPQPGLYAVRLAKGAVELGAEIRFAPTADPDFPDNAMDRSPLWAALVDGQPDPDASPSPSDTCWNVYLYGRRIDEAEYRFLMATTDWHRSHTSDSPHVSPTKKIDLNRLDPQLLLL